MEDFDGVWIRSFNDPTFNNNDEGLDVALGPDDSVVVTGHINGLQGGNFFTAKLSRAGDVLWTREIDGGTGSQRDSAVAVAVDNDGGVLVTGTSEGPATGYRPDVLTAKYSPGGDLLWTQRYDGAAQSHDIPWDLAATSDGGAVVVGTTESQSSGADPLVMRYGPDGSLLWVHNKGSHGGDSARAVVLDAADNGPSSSTDAPLAIAADPGGGFFVGGFADYPFEDYLTLRYDLSPLGSEIYCTAKTGLVCGKPAIGFSGASSASTTSGFDIFAGIARGNRSGILMYTDAGRGNFPFQGGTLCIDPSPLRRSVPVNSGGTNGQCDDEFRLDMNAFASGNASGNPAAFLLLVGQLVNTQWWGRDSVGTGSFLSDALEYLVGP